MSIRILIVDDHDIMRKGMCVLLRKCDDVEIVGQATDGRATIELVNALKPDIVIMDIGMPNFNGIEATRQMIDSHPNLKILALSAHSDGTIVDKMIRAGASGYMLKDSTFQELLEGISTILDGRIFLCSRISKVVFSDYISMVANPQWAGSNELNRRERELLKLVCEGHTIKEIAQVLDISPSTVEAHRMHIMQKLSICNIADLTEYRKRDVASIIFLINPGLASVKEISLIYQEISKIYIMMGGSGIDFRTLEVRNGVLTHV